MTARVYFQQDAGATFDPETELDPVTGYPETCADETLGVVCATSDELYNFDFVDVLPDSRDLGLVILDQPITLSEYGELAGPGTLDALATQRGLKDLTFTDSGYGLTQLHPVHVLSFRERLMAKATLVNLRSALTDGFNLQTTNNPGNDRGGTCSGDSGGPVFLGGFTSNLIVAVTSFGLSEQTCTGVDFAYRVDTQAAIAWILDTVATSSQPDEVNDIVIVEPSSQSVAAAPGTAAKHKKTSKDKHKKHGKAKDESHKRSKGKAQRHR